MFWKGIHHSATAAFILLLTTLTGCSHYAFKYKPYNSPQAYASWSEVESTVKRLESYARNCRPEQVTEGSCTTFAEEYQHTLTRVKQTDFRLAPSHIRKLETMSSLYRNIE